jgi:hypothetical protein
MRVRWQPYCHVACKGSGRVEGTGVDGEKGTMEGFLLCSGSLALLVGLIALVEGNLYRFGLGRRRKA